MKEPNVVHLLDDVLKGVRNFHFYILVEAGLDGDPGGQRRPVVARHRRTRLLLLLLLLLLTKALVFRLQVAFSLFQLARFAVQLLLLLQVMICVDLDRKVGDQWGKKDKIINQ